jgi:hypothetical protein
VHRAPSDRPPVVLDLALWSDAELLDEELRLWCEMWDGYERRGTTWDGATWERWDLVIEEIHRRRLTPRGEWWRIPSPASGAAGRSICEGARCVGQVPLGPETLAADLADPNADDLAGSPAFERSAVGGELLLTVGDVLPGCHW